MNDRANLLHNMSAPPKTVISYAGLSGLATKSGFGGTGLGSAKYSHNNVFGAFVAFRLPKGMRSRSPASILERLGEEAGPHAEQELLNLIERRARDLPIPDGCLVKPCDRYHPSPWPDLVAALAVITKSSANVWLRAKSPSLSMIGKRSSLSLLLPPAFAARPKEMSR